MTTWTQILIQQRLFGRRAATTSSYGGVIVGFVAEIFRDGYGWNGARFGSVVVTCKHSSTSEIFADIIYQHYTRPSCQSSSSYHYRYYIIHTINTMLANYSVSNRRTVLFLSESFNFCLLLLLKFYLPDSTQVYLCDSCVTTSIC